MYHYPCPHPAVTTDIALFTVQQQQLQVVLIRRENPPYQNQWALPGGFVDSEEDLDSCAVRELEEETGISGIYLEQLYTFGQPDRDPRERVITIAYYALMAASQLALRPASDARTAAWHPVTDLPGLAFDHADIIALAQQRLAAKLDYSTIAFNLMPPRFTLSELQQVYEIIRNEPLDKRNFRKRVMAYDCLQETGERRRNGSHRPAMLYKVKTPGQLAIVK